MVSTATSTMPVLRTFRDVRPTPRDGRDSEDESPCPGCTRSGEIDKPPPDAVRALPPFARGVMHRGNRCARRGGGDPIADHVFGDIPVSVHDVTPWAPNRAPGQEPSCLMC